MSKADADTKNEVVLDATRDLFKTFHENVRTHHRLMNVTTIAIELHIEYTDLLNITKTNSRRRPKHKEQSALTRALQRLKNDADFIKVNKEQQLFTLRGQFLVTLWGVLESHVDDVLIAALTTDRSLLQAADIQKIKLSIAQLESASPAERLEYLLDGIQREHNSKFKKGIEQFEVIFGLFGLSGRVDSDMKRVFLEFSAMRNLIAHRRSIVDKRFSDQCPWLQLDLGAVLPMSQHRIYEYFRYVILYATLIQERFERRYQGGERAIQALAKWIATQTADIAKLRRRSTVASAS
jgi:hypothetical protein